jgi:phosphohistidine swiveling domain-containing protein
MSPNDIHWKPTVKREESILFGYYVLQGIRAPIFETETGIQFGFKNRVVRDHQVYMDTAEIDELHNLMSAQPLESLKRLAEKCSASCSRIINNATAIASKGDLSAMSQLDLIELFKNYSDQVVRHAPYLMITLVAEEIIKKQILPDIEALVLKHAPESELPSYYLCIYSPLEENFISQEISSLLHIASLVASDKRLIYLFQQERELILSKLKAENHPIYYLLLEHHKRFAWINLSYYLGTPWTMADFIDRVNEWITTEPNLPQRHWDYVKTHLLLDAKLESILAKHNVPQDTADGLKLLRWYLFLRTHRVDCFFLADFLARNLLQEVAKRIGLSYGELVWLSSVEIIDALLNHRVVTDFSFMHRRERHTMLLFNGRPQILDDSDWLVLPQPTAEAYQMTEEGLPGMVAFPGIAIGRARIMRSQADVQKVEKGDILIASMTTPDYVAAMERASAFVTDEGGLACHAALISRDLRVPCLIATKHATKCIPDGSLIEVNTFDGVVRIKE